MTRLLFTNLTMLAGLGALAVPVLIHLLLRQRKRRLRFSTLRFFEKHDEQSSQRRKLRNMLLLATRLLLLTLLVLAFARPFLTGGQGAGPRRPHRLAVLVVDRTASVQAVDSGGPRWPRVREALRKILADLTPDDRAALVGCGTRCEVLSGAAPPEMIERLLGDLQPTAGGAGLGEGLQLAKQVVSSAGERFLPTIYVASDLQVNACRDLSICPLPAALEVQAVRVGDVLTPNVAVAGLSLDSRGPERPHAILAQFGEEEAKQVKLTLAIDDKEIFARAIGLATGGLTRIELALPPLSPGWHSGVVRVYAGDALPLDDARYEAFFVPQPIRTLMVETRPKQRHFEQEGYFVSSALDPLRGATNAGFSAFDVSSVGVEELTARLSSRADSLAADWVILPGLKEIPAALGRTLRSFVEGGGGLLLFLGDDVSATRYNTEFREILPAPLGHIERSEGQEEEKWRLEEYDLFSPMFRVFRHPNSGNLLLVEFSRRMTLGTNEGMVVPARFGDGTPAIVTRNVGRGRVALVNTSADRAWTDWPRHKTFVPWLHSMGYLLTQRAGAEPGRAAAHLLAADDADVALGTAARSQTLRFCPPGKPALPVTADASGRVRNLDCSTPGVYSLREQGGRELQRVAVNVPGEESDLSALGPAAFDRQLARIPEPRPDTLLAGLFGEQESQNELWRLLLLSVLALLFVEVFLANRSYA
jgi:hypothetical protein